MKRWDLVVVGAGTAGLVAAQTAVLLGGSVLLVEAERTGGDCLWTGCVPSKALIAAATAAHDARTAHRLGIHATVDVDFSAVMARVHAAMAEIAPVDSPEALRAAGVHVSLGRAVFTGPDQLEIDGDPVSFRQAVIATGSAPVVPPGFETALTTDTVWSLTTLPARLVVLGGGSVGCELGQAFARLGADVTIVESTKSLLSQEDPDAAAMVVASLRADGVTVRTGAAAEPADGALVIGGERLGYDQLLVAVGRRPRTTDLGLDRAGVERTEKGHVVVDAHLRSTNPRIWAAGDVTGHPAYTHTAGVHGSLAATNALLGLRRAVTGPEPRVTYTQPELAAVGHTDAGDRTVGREAVDRTVTDDVGAVLTRLRLGRRGRLEGATVVGLRAGEVLAELVLAVREGVTASALAQISHAYPTYSDGSWRAAVAQVQQTLTAPVPRRAVHTLAMLRRRWLDLRAHW